MRNQVVRLILGVLVWALLCRGTTAWGLEFTTREATDADVTVSPDGTRLVFTLLGHLFRMPAGGGSAEQLTFGPCFDSDPVYSPDGRAIAFLSDRDGSGGNVFLLDPANQQLRQVTHEARAGQPCWTPDGQAILYLRYLPREQDPRPASILSQPGLCDLRKVRRDGQGPPELLRGPGLLRSILVLPAGQPAWTLVEQELAPGRFFPRSTTHLETLSPHDGKVTRLRSWPGDLGRVWARSDGGGLYYRAPDFRFLSLRDEGQPQSPPTARGAFTTRFAMTADGTTAYLSDQGRIVRIAVDRGERTVLGLSARVKLDVAEPVRPRWSPPEAGATVRLRAVLHPELSPDGRRLTFMAAGSLWEQPLDGSPARRLLNDDAWSRDPALSPDGRQLAFVASRAGRRELRILDLATGRVQTLVSLDQGSWARFPSWSRDGARLVYQKSDSLSSPFELIAVDLSDGKAVKLATVAGNWSSRPQLAFDGDTLDFTSRTSGPGSWFRKELADKGEPKRLTQLARHLHEARVSSNGKWLAFRRNAELWVAPLDRVPVEENDARRLSLEGDATFSFTPDSSAVIYAVGSRVWRHPLVVGQRQEIAVRLAWNSPSPPPLLVRGVRVLDLEAGEFGDAVSLFVESGAIRWIGLEGEHALPRDVAVLDAAGKYAIPGLFDFHVHSAWANHEADPDTFLAYGVTSLRDTGGSLEYLGALADRGESSDAAIPRYFASGEILEGPQPIWGDAFFQVYTAEEARNLVKSLKERGTHLIKVYPSLSWPLQRAVAEEARLQGLPVAGHGISAEEIVKSVTLGYACLEHCPMRLNDDLRQLLAKAGTRCTPTLAILGGHSTLLNRDPKRLEDAKLRALFPESQIRAARDGGLAAMGESWPSRLAALRANYLAGIKLHAGTDSLMTGTFFGASLHWELEHLAEAGLKPLDVLRLATQEAAAGVGAEGHLGRLVPGKLADIVLLDANPLESIRNTQAIWRVVKGGRVFDPSHLPPRVETAPKP